MRAGLGKYSRDTAVLVPRPCARSNADAGHSGSPPLGDEQPPLLQAVQGLERRRVGHADPAARARLRRSSTHRQAVVARSSASEAGMARSLVRFPSAISAHRVGSSVASASGCRACSSRRRGLSRSSCLAAGSRANPERAYEARLSARLPADLSGTGGRRPPVPPRSTASRIQRVYGRRSAPAPQVQAAPRIAGRLGPVTTSSMAKRREPQCRCTGALNFLSDSNFLQSGRPDSNRRRPAWEGHGRHEVTTGLLACA